MEVADPSARPLQLASTADKVKVGAEPDPTETDEVTEHPLASVTVTS